MDCTNDTELSVLFVNDDEIREINRKYLGRDYPTDVISFPMNEGEFTGINVYLLGDVVVSLDNAEKFARKKNEPLEDEVTFLLIHGILHLCGYDHEKEGSDASAMKKKEKELYDNIKKERQVK